MSDPSSGEFFEQVSDALLGSVAPQYAGFGGYTHGYGIKVTYGEGDRTKEHYESQIVRASPKGGLVLEIGFHTEYPKADRNKEVLSVAPRARKALAQIARERAGRRAVSRQRPVAPHLRDVVRVRLPRPDLPFEVSDRLAAYVAAFEPLLDR